jgi:hypothetical protein
VWRRTSVEGYDQQTLGLEIETAEKLPGDAYKDNRLRREYFNTKAFGKSAAGHDFVDELTDDEKTAVLEYLKTL